MTEPIKLPAEPDAYVYEVRFTNPGSQWTYYGLYRIRSQVEAIHDRHDSEQDIEGRIVPLYREAQP
jgi:hypothetical protein